MTDTQFMFCSMVLQWDGVWMQMRVLVGFMHVLVGAFFFSFNVALDLTQYWTLLGLLVQTKYVRMRVFP